MDVKTEVIVLNKIKYNDSAYISNLLCKDYGRIAVFLRIPKTSKSSIKPGLFFPLNIIELELAIKPSRSIQTIKNCNSLNTSSKIFQDVYKASIAQFIAEVVSNAVREEEPNKELYLFLKYTIETLSELENGFQNIHLVFLKDFASILGFAFSNNISKETPYFNLREGMFLPFFTSDEESLDEAESELFSQVLDYSYSDLDKIRLNYNQRKAIIEKLLLYYKFHIDSFADIKSIKVLHEVFAD